MIRERWVSPWGEIAEHLPTGSVVLFRKEAEVVTGGDGAPKNFFRLHQAALPGKAFGKPEGAGEKGSLVPCQVVGAVVRERKLLMLP